MSKMIISRKILTALLVLIIAAALVYFFFFKKPEKAEPPGETQEASGQPTASEEVALPVKVATAKRGDLVITLKSPGEAVTDRKITVKAEVSGVINSLKVEESQHVKAGDLLVELDDREYRLELERYEADRLKNLSDLLLEKQFATTEQLASQTEDQRLKKAKEEYERARQHFRSGEIGEEEFEAAHRQYELALIESGEKKEEIMAAAKGLTQAEISVKKARMNLAKTKIYAPFAGVVFDIKVSPSERMSANSELFMLVNIDSIQVQAKVLESEVGKIKVGREAELRFSAHPGKAFKGRIKAISPIINPEDKTCKVIIEMANPGEEIKPGMHTEVKIVTEIHRDKLLIPQEAILVREGRKLAFVVENGLAKWKYIQVGLENEDYAEVLPGEREGEGIREGDQVIIEGHFTLAHDARVRAIQ